MLPRPLKVALLMAGASALAACASVSPRYPSQAQKGSASGAPSAGGQKVGKPYQVGGIWYVPREQPDYDVRGVASWYGDAFHLKATANGEIFDMNQVSAAHTTLPLPSMVEVTNLDNGRKLVVRVNDRGPFVGDRIIDLSREAARQLGMDRAGLANVRVRYVGAAPLTGRAEGVRVAMAPPTLGPKPLATRLTPPPLAPGADAVMELAGARAAMARAPVEAMPAAVGTISSEALPPITGAAISSAPLGPIAAPPPLPAPVLASRVSPLKVQAGAFSSEINARAAAARLAPAGAAAIEPLERDGFVLYRVMLPAPEDEAAAYALRDRVAEFGFEDARVVRSF
jgi:rare lipoprotein A